MNHHSSLFWTPYHCLSEGKTWGPS